MNIRYTTLLIGLMLWGVLSAQPSMKLEKTTHDFGVIGEDNPVSCTFSFVNEGNEPLVIHQVMPGCGCTAYDYTKSPIPPGEKGSIKITYNGKGKGFGPFKKGIAIRTNATTNLTRIFIKGTMEEKKEKEKEKEKKK